MNREDRWIAVAFWASAVMIFGSYLSLNVVACGGASLSTQAARVQGAVTVLAEIVDPAYQLAVDGCIARERLEVAAERDGGQVPQTTDQNLAQIRARCDEVVDAFLAMRGLLAGAESALNEGNVSRAEAELEKVRVMWARLKP